MQFSLPARTAVAVAIGAGALFATCSAHAQIVYSGPINLAIPVTFSGLYLNVVTGVSNSNPALVPGWDLNPWGTSTLFLYANNSTELTNGVIDGNGTAAQVDRLPAGYVIDGSNTFGRTSIVESTGAFGFQLNNSDNLIGFRFTNEGAGTTHFGWARFSIGTALNSSTRTLVDYAFELTPNTAIQAGVVPEPSTYALMALGLMGVAAAARRRMARQD